MLYLLLAELVVIVHFAFIAFIVLGGLLVWRWPRLLWLHLPAVLWGALIIAIGFTCPLTPLEKYFRRLGDEHVYRGGFIDHYIKGVLYPRNFNSLIQFLAAIVIVIGYAGLFLQRRARASGANDHATMRPNQQGVK